MKNNIYIESTIRKFLKHVHDNIDLENSKSAIIAGGYVRDITLGVPFSDVDIYIEYSTSNDKSKPLRKISFWQDQFRDLVYDYKQNIKFSNEHYLNANLPIHVICNVRYLLDNFQIIMIKKDPIDFVNNWFDIGLCKCYFTGKKIVYTSDFMSDKKNKTISIVKPNMSEKEFAYSYKHHVKKLKSKYPTYKVCVNEQNIHYLRSHHIKKIKVK